MLKVLLVEDENLIRRGLQYKMDWTEVNCVVVGEAATGQEGLTQIKALRPDIVITDIRMPDMDGLEMLREGRGVCPFHAIIISGYGEFDYAQQAIRLGVAEYLLKPVDVTSTVICGSAATSATRYTTMWETTPRQPFGSAASMGLRADME